MEYESNLTYRRAQQGEVEKPRPKKKSKRSKKPKEHHKEEAHENVSTDKTLGSVEDSSTQDTQYSRISQDAQTTRLIEDLLQRSSQLTLVSRSSSRMSKLFGDVDMDVSLLEELYDAPLSSEESLELQKEISQIVLNTVGQSSQKEKRCLIEECGNVLSKMNKNSELTEQQMIKLRQKNLQVQLDKFRKRQRQNRQKKPEITIVPFDQKKYDEGFPGLVGSQGNGPSFMEKLKGSEKKVQTGYFQPISKKTNTKLPDRSEQLNSHFHPYDNKSEGGAEVRNLIREYEGMDIKDMKLIYRNLEDYHTCRKFLEEFYSCSKSIERVVLDSPKKQAVTTSEKETYKQPQPLIDEDIMQLSLAELRAYVWRQVRLKAVFTKASSHALVKSSRLQLQSLGRLTGRRFDQYVMASQLKLIEQTLKERPNKIDLHGYLSAEALDIAESYIERLRQKARQFVNDSRKIDRDLRLGTFNGKPFVELEIVTGKGGNSKNSQSVLKPVMQDLCQEKKLHYKNLEGGVLVFIPF